ncbi:MAG: hypothetical protein ACYCYA_03190 [Actinomycetes bacterium]
MVRPVFACEVARFGAELDTRHRLGYTLPGQLVRYGRVVELTDKR